MVLRADTLNRGGINPYFRFSIIVYLYLYGLGFVFSLFAFVFLLAAEDIS